MVIDCDRCDMRGIACGDCAVAVLIGEPRHRASLDVAERRALTVLANAAMIPPLRYSRPQAKAS
ncbi:MAG: hypothetical protein JOY82_25785 [Streptosporangiaceae bacterium]|nr:hypothetical protein [Streptosporangiaceae bacterium]MBV9857898.1 hypothetical protein [Streptosporangiaceae bacterium]